MAPGGCKSGAAFDLTGAYRYLFRRAWDTALPSVGFIMLNPSTADQHHDDPTIRRCLGFARAWGFGSLEVVNLFALRATSPAALLASPDPVGPENDEHIRAMAARVDLVVAAWGNHGARFGRDAEVARLLGGRVTCLRVTAQGQPKHPLYVPGSVRPQPWRMTVPSL